MSNEAKLTKPARVHHTVFAAGLPERMVIECAQQHYEWIEEMKRANPGKPLLSFEDLDCIRRGEPLKELRLPLQGHSPHRPVPPYVHLAPEAKSWVERTMKFWRKP
jgi:hypothetical protein